MKKQIIDKINDVKSKIYEDLKLDEICNFFSEENHKLLHSCLETIFKDIDYVIKNDEISKEEIQTQQEHLLLLLDNFEKTIALQALSEKFKQFLDLVLQCIFNYNKNIFKSEEINDKILVCQRLLTSIITMTETINILKSLITHLESKELKENSPLYQGLTQEYIKLLDS